MKVLFLYVKSNNESWAEAASQEFEKKIGRIIPFKIKALKSKNIARDQAEYKILEEEKMLLKEIKENDWVILFDEKGKFFKNSERFSEEIIHSLESGKQRLVFIIGGAFGLGPQVKKRANLLLSLSSMTMNHLVAQTVALEQIYRALTIWKGIPYHNS